MCLYWIANATFAGVQTLCINPAARSTLKRWVTFSKKEEAIPPPPKEVKRVVKSESGGASASAAKVMSESKENVDALLKDVKSSVFKEK